jgi:hypothetical protein
MLSFKVYPHFLPLLLILALVLSDQDIRKNRYGSNCLVVETGTVTPYYQCYGCVIENAMGCLNDMRNNASGNVHPNCSINAIAQTPNTDYCCPKLGAANLLYSGSAYPETLRCIAGVGCQDSSIYADLLAVRTTLNNLIIIGNLLLTLSSSFVQECEYTCPGLLDQRGDRSICLAVFNASLRQIQAALLLGLLTTATTAVLLVLQ